MTLPDDILKFDTSFPQWLWSHRRVKWILKGENDFFIIIFL